MKKQIISGLLASICLLGTYAQQPLTVETCQEKAKERYPLAKQYGLIEQTSEFNISNANKGYLPQLTFSTRATYQSEVTEIPISIPNTPPIPSLKKDQYQAALEASQLIWDGGIIKARKNITQAGTEVEKQKLEVDLYTLNERVNQLFFGILLLKEQLVQNEIIQKELQTSHDRVSAYMQNGVASQADLDAIRVEQLNAIQRETELGSTQKAYCSMLSALTGIPIDGNSLLQKPVVNLSLINDSTNHRPELKLFEAQNKLFESQKSLVTAGNLPKIGLFVQSGYGRPGLNMLTNKFSPFYIGGLRLSWNISGFYTQKAEMDKLELGKKTVDVQKETFLFNSDLKTTQQKTEIEKLQLQIKNDDSIIGLRQNIKKAADARFENGTITVSDLIREINAEDQARQVKSLHEIQLILNVYQLKNNTNN
ncbi:MAG TPA: TolC family protein [Paludibacter sp.]|nr:TolC family protein [Paludibacter sp.]